MTVTNREARQWDQMRHEAAMRKIARERMAAVLPILQGRELPKPSMPAQKPVAVKQGRLF